MCCCACCEQFLAQLAEEEELEDDEDRYVDGEDLRLLWSVRLQRQLIPNDALLSFFLACLVLWE